MQEGLRAIVLAAGDERQGAREHVGREEFHAALDDGGMGRDRRRRGTGRFAAGARRGGEHGDGEEGGARELRQGAVAQDVAVREVGLDERHFFHAQDTVLVRVQGPAERFEPGHDRLPVVLREVFLGRIVGSDHQLHEDICRTMYVRTNSLHPQNRSGIHTSLVTEPEVPQCRFRVSSRGPLRDLQRARDFGKLGGRAFREPQLQFGVLVRGGLDGSQAAGDAFTQHHPILDVGIGRLRPSG